ncbi:MAG: hypothetical protein K6E29_01225 [Cyanobacteria bacterium RUI128]|nr:hypothetical protein [Cyanobacteria bacterium RUI128]
MKFVEKLLNPLKNNKKPYQDISKESKQVAQNTPSDLLINARNIAGNRIQNMINTLEGCRWLRAEYTYPSFDSMNFAYKNKIFSVVIDIRDEEGNSYIPEEYVKRQLYAAEVYNLVPCKYIVTVDNPEAPDLSSLKPANEGWNLFNTKTEEEVIPEQTATDEKTEMSEWEMRTIGIRFIMNYLKSKKYIVRNFQDTLEVDPQIWFEDANGKRSWVLLRCSKSGEELKKPEKMNEIIRRCFKFDGYYIHIAFSSFNTDQKLYRDEKYKTDVLMFEKIHSVI